MRDGQSCQRNITLPHPMLALSAHLRTADLLPLNFYIYTVPKKGVQQLSTVEFTSRQDELSPLLIRRLPYLT